MMVRLLDRLLPVGTRSVLFGAHCWFIHPIFVALAWTRLYGFPKDIRLWVAFFVHDLGYWGKPNMDGPEGELHPLLGAKIMYRLFDKRRVRYWETTAEWHDFCLYHSRFLAKRDGERYSLLCVADKLAMALEPWWLYLPRVWLSGELKEYMSLMVARDEGEGKYAGERVVLGTQGQPVTPMGWWRRCSAYCRAWAYEHRNGDEDTWTPEPTSTTVEPPRTGIVGTIYLLHFDPPYKHCQHYLGWTTDIDIRIKTHLECKGSPLVRAAIQSGCKVKLVRTWVGDRNLERTIKKRGSLKRSCPECKTQGFKRNGKSKKTTTSKPKNP